MTRSQPPSGPPSGDPPAAAVPAAGDAWPWGRRQFLEATGFSLFTAALGGCWRAPVRSVLSAPSEQEEVAAGQSQYFASTCGGCAAACGVVVRTRDGRPIKLEGNPDHPLSRGGLCAVGQAELLALYDSHRLQTPRLEGREVDWSAVDLRVRDELARAEAAGRAVCLLTDTVHSPTTHAALDRWLAQHPGARHVMYDPLSASAIADAHERTHGRRVVPRYRFDGADVVVSLGADFLGTWISPVEYTAGYSARRVPGGTPAAMSYHVQIEPRVSLTGCRADRRWSVRPGDLGPVAAHLALAVARRAGRELQLPAQAGRCPLPAGELEALAARLWEARGRALIVCDSQDVATQTTCNLLNDLVQSYGQTVDLTAVSQQRLGHDRALEELLDQIAQGQVGVLIVAGVNPLYDLPRTGRWAEMLAAATSQGAAQADVARPFVVRIASHADETAAVADCVCPESHWLETWGDAAPSDDTVSLLQPTIARRGASRSLLECVLAWTGEEPAAGAQPSPAYAAVRSYWETELRPRAGAASQPPTAFWQDALRRGALAVTPPPVPPVIAPSPPGSSPARAWEQDDASLSLVLYPKVGLHAGRPAHNPWLQELPDPVTKVVWDNYASLGPGLAAELGVGMGDRVRLTAGGTSVELPVWVQEGQHDRVVAAALGYGRMGTERFAGIGPQWLEARPTVSPHGLVGTNVAPLLELAGGLSQPTRRGVSVQRVAGRHRLATTQQHHSLEVPAELATAGAERRTTVQTTTLEAYQRDPQSGRPAHAAVAGELWPDDHPYTGHHWGMVIDLTRCTGCSACVIACQAENNVPAVGRDEVARSREMHWLRIDRYWEHEAGEVTALVQPMLCQHCDHAPCENVCPVLATVHSEEGLNQQVYNRCVGTRYCANNCPFKVRRFNWFEYSRQDHLERGALNPDVVVRSRGVMEKCSFCVQRIRQETRRARQHGAPLVDGVLQTACQQSCPASAITFGDRNDPDSAVVRAEQDPRYFHVLPELDLHPAVGYLRVIHNRPGASEDSHHV